MRSLLFVYLDIVSRYFSIHLLFRKTPNYVKHCGSLITLVGLSVGGGRGESQCRMALLRNGNVALMNLRNPYVDMLL